MGAESAMAAITFLVALLAMLVSISTRRRLLATQAELASVAVALDRERQATADSVADIHRSTVEEVATLLENVLAQVDTDITAKVAEALALLSPCPGSGMGEADHSLAATVAHESSEPLPRNRTDGRSSGPPAPAFETTERSSDWEPKAGE